MPWICRAFDSRQNSFYTLYFKKRLLCFGLEFYNSVNIKVMPSWSIKYAGISWTDLPVLVKSSYQTSALLATYAVYKTD